MTAKPNCRRRSLISKTQYQRTLFHRTLAFLILLLKVALTMSFRSWKDIEIEMVDDNHKKAFASMEIDPINTMTPYMEETDMPSADPTMSPSDSPSDPPSSSPTKSPSDSPSGRPSAKPSIWISTKPSPTVSSSPSTNPSHAPTSYPTTSFPTDKPSSAPSSHPTKNPTKLPTTPSVSPTNNPTKTPSSSPTENPTATPSETPSYAPSPPPTTRVQNIQGNGGCPDGTFLYYIVLEDVWGDGWDGTLIAIGEYDTELKQTNPGWLYKDSLENGFEKHDLICLDPKKCYNVLVGGGKWTREVRWDIREVILGSGEKGNAVAKGNGEMDCLFSLPIEEQACETTCLGR